jgi:hypothetical protein
MFPLQEDRTYGKRLPTRTRRVVEEEGRPSKVFLYHDQSAHKEAKRKMVMEDKDGEDFWNGEPVRRQILLLSPLNMYK